MFNVFILPERQGYGSLKYIRLFEPYSLFPKESNDWHENDTRFWSQYKGHRYLLASGYKEDKQCFRNIFGNDTTRIMFGVHDTGQPHPFSPCLLHEWLHPIMWHQNSNFFYSKDSMVPMPFSKKFFFLIELSYIPGCLFSAFKRIRIIPSL